MTLLTCDYYKNKINSQRHICKQAKSHTYIIYTIQYRNPIPGHISGENHNSKRYMHPNVHCSTIYNSQDMEATWMSINRWMDKEDVEYTYVYSMEYYSAIKNNVICSNMDRPRDYHTRWSKPDNNKYHMLLLKCRILKKIQMNL